MKVGDRVIYEQPDLPADFRYNNLIGTIHSFTVWASSDAINIRVENVDITGVAGGPEGTWIAQVKYCRPFYEAEPATFDGVVIIKSGYEPDGFDAEKHREFMRTL